MATTTAAIDVAVPIRMAYDRFADPESHARFLTGIDEVRQIDEASAMVHGLDRTWRMTWTGEAPKRLEWRSPGGATEHASASFETIGPQQTRITLTRQHDQDPEEAKTVLEADLARFRDYVEAFERDPWIEVRPPIVFA